MEKAKDERNVAKSRRLWSLVTSAIVLMGAVAVAAPLAVSAWSFLGQKSSQERWLGFVERAEKSKKPAEKPAALARTLTASGDGLAPKSEVSVSFDGAFETLGHADERGHASIKFEVPRGAGPGIHSVTMRGVAQDGAPLVLTANVTIGQASYPDVRLTSGEEVAFLVIDAIGVRSAVREGASWPNLARGPVRVSGTAPIGSPGTTLISGHRTMYTAPFSNLDKLKPGDLIKLYTKNSLYAYKVVRRRAVSPENTEDIEAFGEPKLVLSTCEPKYFSTKRLLVIAKLTKVYSY